MYKKRIGLILLAILTEFSLECSEKLDEQTTHYSPIFNAILNDDINTLNQLIAAHADIHQPHIYKPENGEDPIKVYEKITIPALIFAISHKNIKALKALINAGANLNEPKEVITDVSDYYPDEIEIYPPLIIAIENQDIEAMQLLIEAGASLDEPMKIITGTETPSSIQIYPPFIVAMNNHESMQLLLTKRPDIIHQEYKETHDRGPKKIITYSPLIKAINQENIGNIQFLIKAGVDIHKEYEYTEINRRTQSPETTTMSPLIKAIGTSDTYEPLDCVAILKVLIDEGADVNSVKVKKDQNGEIIKKTSALAVAIHAYIKRHIYHIITSEDDDKVVKFLHAHGARIAEHDHKILENPYYKNKMIEIGIEI